MYDFSDPSQLDEDDRPTLPAPWTEPGPARRRSPLRSYGARTRRPRLVRVRVRRAELGDVTTQFFAASCANDAAPLDDADEVAAWWLHQRRRGLSRYVAALLAACVVLLVVGALR